MKQSWRLYFENFGRIKEGEIEIAPLVLIVGDNNSGKSYVMSLLWGIMTEGKTIFPKETPTSKSYRLIDEFLIEAIGTEQSLTPEQCHLFIVWYNDLLRLKKLELVERVFRKKMDIKSLQIKDYVRKQPLKIIFEQKESLEGTRYSKTKNHIRFPYTEQSKLNAAERYKMAQYIMWTLLMGDMTAPLHAPGGFSRATGEALYLPASRTGFMLTYRALVQELMETRISEEFSHSSNFTLPVFRFLQGLIAVEGKGSNEFISIANFLEQSILSGELKMKKDIVPSFYYSPNGENNELPMYLSSSLVTELAPLILFLKTKQTYRTLFFEEAEAHLHPRVQKILATAIAKIVNHQMPVFLTTHSDLILQQFNNLIKLNNHPEKEKLLYEYGYKSEDVLNSDEVRAYEFLTKGNYTYIQELKATPYGFPAPTFNRVLLQLQKETQAFEGEEG